MATPLKKHYLTLIFLIITTLFIFSHYTLSPPQQPPPPPLHLSTATPKFTFTIKLLTYNRLSSLTRCLTSLSSAHYLNNTIHLHIYIDHFPNSTSPVHVGRKLESFKEILSFVDGFVWKHGIKLVHYRTFNAGLQAQWLESWWPVSDDDFVFVVEDDVQVSPFYYLFLKRIILGCYYDDRSDFVFGASLQRPRFVPGKHGNKMNLDNESKLFLYQLVGTWGQLLFPKPWKEFRLWYDDHKSKGIKPFLDGMVTNGWYKKMGERIWTPWFIKFIHLRGYFNIYTNFPHERALSVSHRDAGVNYGKSIGPDSELLDENSHEIDLANIEPLSNMHWYDFCFRKVLPGRIAKSLNKVDHILHTMEPKKPIWLVSVLDSSEKSIRNLICHFERLDIRNYIFMIPQSASELLLDFSRRGHPVIDTVSVYDSVIRSKKPSPELITDIIVKAYVIKKCLELGIDTWVVPGNMIPLSNNLVFPKDGAIDDFYVYKGSRFFVAGSSSSSRKIWGKSFLQKLADVAESIVTRDNGGFIDVVEKCFERIGVRLKMVDALGFSLKLETVDLNQSVSTNTQMISWSSVTGSDLVSERLQRLGMWIIDGDSSCNAVVCHQS